MDTNNKDTIEIFFLCQGCQTAESVAEKLAQFISTATKTLDVCIYSFNLCDRVCDITQPGGSYRYHYDRNTITAILYLNETDGGETECYPNHRLRIAQTSLQQTIDRVFQSEAVRWTFGRLVLVRPRTGRLLIMRGNRCLHSVREVNGSEDRINLVMSYDGRDAQYANSNLLNSYLYTHDDLQTRDPNYA